MFSDANIFQPSEHSPPHLVSVTANGLLDPSVLENKTQRDQEGRKMVLLSTCVLVIFLHLLFVLMDNIITEIISVN